MSETFETLRYEQRGNVALITYDRQERRNAWNVPMYREAVAAVEQANAAEAVGAIVITNAGPVFCAGTDFKAPPEPRDPDTGRIVNVATLSMAQDDSWLHLMSRSKPVIAAVQGAAVGLGVTQILAADIRVGSRSSSYSFPFVSLGLMPELGATALLPRLLGYGRAVDLCLTAAKIDAEEAQRVGLITRIFPDESFVNDVVVLASQLASYPPLQMRLTKELLEANATVADKNAFLQREVDAFVTMFRARKAAATSTG
jgi:2-(1,2-epoxy-1,2-dihydrophenyl)acetyl-CoA isomerase